MLGGVGSLGTAIVRTDVNERPKKGQLVIWAFVLTVKCSVLVTFSNVNVSMPFLYIHFASLTTFIPSYLSSFICSFSCLLLLSSFLAATCVSILPSLPFLLCSYLFSFLCSFFFTVFPFFLSFSLSQCVSLTVLPVLLLSYSVSFLRRFHLQYSTIPLSSSLPFPSFAGAFPTFILLSFSKRITLSILTLILSTPS